MKRAMRPTERDKDTALTPGTGALCAEAQADGVPCNELGRDCEVCGKAVTRSERDWPAHPAESA
jgi:hypothetical protein